MSEPFNLVNLLKGLMAMIEDCRRDGGEPRLWHMHPDIWERLKLLYALSNVLFVNPKALNFDVLKNDFEEPPMLYGYPIEFCKNCGRGILSMFWQDNSRSTMELPPDFYPCPPAVLSYGEICERAERYLDIIMKGNGHLNYFRWEMSESVYMEVSRRIAGVPYRLLLLSTQATWKAEERFYNLPTWLSGLPIVLNPKIAPGEFCLTNSHPNNSLHTNIDPEKGTILHFHNPTAKNQPEGLKAPRWHGSSNPSRN